MISTKLSIHPRFLGALLALGLVTALPAPQVNFTVVHVQAGALVNFGGIDPRLIPVPQQRAAISTGGQVSDNGNGGAIGVTDDKWAETHGNGGKRS